MEEEANKEKLTSIEGLKPRLYRFIETILARRAEYPETIETAAGSRNVRKGDYIIRYEDGSLRVMGRRYFEAEWVELGEPVDLEGFSYFGTKYNAQAIQMPRDFEVVRSGTVLEGSAGDYIVTRNGRSWVIDKASFEKYYRAVVEKPQVTEPEAGEPEAWL